MHSNVSTLKCLINFHTQLSILGETSTTLCLLVDYILYITIHRYMYIKARRITHTFLLLRKILPCILIVYLALAFIRHLRVCTLVQQTGGVDCIHITVRVTLTQAECSILLYLCNARSATPKPCTAV